MGEVRPTPRETHHKQPQRQRCTVCDRMALPLMLFAAAEERRLVCRTCVLHGDVPSGWTHLRAYVGPRQQAQRHSQDHGRHPPMRQHPYNLGVAKL